MPNVNGKKYPYTTSGIKAAKKAAAKKTVAKKAAEPVSMSNSKILKEMMKHQETIRRLDKRTATKPARKPSVKMNKFPGMGK
jgi:hypothetical protein